MAANNRKFQEFMDRFAADTVSTKVRSLMWECWVAATEATEAGEPTHNTQSTAIAQIAERLERVANEVDPIASAETLRCVIFREVQQLRAL